MSATPAESRLLPLSAGVVGWDTWFSADRKRPSTYVYLTPFLFLWFADVGLVGFP